MAFSTLRGRPKARVNETETDSGTPELRMKHAMGATTEPIDLCLNRGLITRDQHWCGLHLRWLYTVRYGAPVITTRYADHINGPSRNEDAEQWRSLREREYHEAIAALHQQRRYEPVMRLCVFNEAPAFLNTALHQRAWQDGALTHQLERTHLTLAQGLDILITLWRRQPLPRDTHS